MLRKTMTAATLGAALLAGGAHASDLHEVTIFDNDFMPPLVFAQPGDIIRFYNTDETNHRVMAEDDSWETALINPETYVEVIVTPGAEQNYMLDPALVIDLEEEDEGEEENLTESGYNSDAAEGDLDEGEVTFDEVVLSND